MQIGKTYIRTSPDGKEAQVVPKKQEDVDYFNLLKEHGYKFEEVNVNTPNVCISCEG